MALAIPVFRPKQSARFAAQSNSPPLTWILHSVALRNGMIPGSRRCTSAPSDRKSSAPSLRIFSPVLIDLFLQTNLVMFQNPVPLALRFQQRAVHPERRCRAPLAHGGCGPSGQRTVGRFGLDVGRAAT